MAKIGLYKHKETGDYQVVIDCIDNVIKVHNLKFKKVKNFEYKEPSRTSVLRQEIDKLQSLLSSNTTDYMIPIFKHGETLDNLQDEHINTIVENLIKLKCKRRELLDSFFLE